MKPGNLNPKQRQTFNMWGNLGLSEQSALRAMERDGQITLSDDKRQTRMFSEGFGLSASAARRAVEGRAGPSVRSVSEPGRSSAAPEPGDGLRLVAKIDQLAGDICSRGESKDAALRSAFYQVFDAAPDSHEELGCRGAGRRWPELLKSPRSTGDGQKVRSPAGRAWTSAADAQDRPSLRRSRARWACPNSRAASP